MSGNARLTSLQAVILCAVLAFLLKLALLINTYGTNDVLFWERDLARIDKKRLSVRDAELLDATQRLAGQVRKWPDGAAPGQRTAASAEPPPPIARIDTASAAGKTINYAQKLLEDVDKMLKEADR